MKPYPAVRECLAQFEDLKVQLESECHFKEEQVSAFAYESFIHPEEGSICLNNHEFEYCYI